MKCNLILGVQYFCSVFHHLHLNVQECEDPSYVAVLASHTAHRAVNKAVATNNATAVNNFDRETKKELEDAKGARSKNTSRAFNLCEQASEFLEAAVRFVSTFVSLILFL